MTTWIRSHITAAARPSRGWVYVGIVMATVLAVLVVASMCEGVTFNSACWGVTGVSKSSGGSGMSAALAATVALPADVLSPFGIPLPKPTLGPPGSLAELTGSSTTPLRV